MIISLINGGLGNQMFQYALGRKLSFRLGTPFKTDTLWFSSAIAGTAVRKYELYYFNIPAEPASKEEIEELKEPHSDELLKRLFNFINARLPYYKRRVLNEKHFHFDPHVLKAGSNTYLVGYWQTEKYFADVRYELLKDFSFRIPMEGKNLELAKIIKRTESISLHVRRADYVSDKDVNRILGVCSPEYYQRAIQYIRDHVKKPVFFVFSDDIDWCRKNLMMEEEIYFVDHNTGDNSYRDMQLMSLCRHNIIANSSFSWWGAWLNKNKEKMVLVPERWFSDPTKSDKDLIPQSWRRM